MFYRYLKSETRVAVDLDGLYKGGTLFLLGGGPSLNDLDLDALRAPGIVTLAVNNVPTVFPSPNLWVCADKPPCFSPHIYASPEIVKFTSIARRNMIVGDTGKRVRDFPSMLFFGLTEGFTEATFLSSHRDIVWWKSVFPIALQLAWRLGFRRVHLVGCGFHSNGGDSYAWKTELTDYQRNYSQRTYNRDLERLRKLKPVFDRNGFEIISSTPDSRANAFLDYVPLGEAVECVRSTMPDAADTTKLAHSSSLTAKPR